jgi:hypothetical protein
VVPFFPIQNFVSVAYQGQLIKQNVQLLTTGSTLIGTNTAGFITQQGNQSAVINTVMDWLNTYPGQAVSINIQSAGTATQLNKILMLYIDNSRNPNSVTVGFVDSQQYLEAPAFTTGYYPVFTNNLFFNVYNGTSGKPPITAQSMTAIIICNFAVPGFLAQNTLSITFNSSSGPIVPTIGDTVTLVGFSSTSANPLTILPSLTLPEQYVLTAITINASNLFVDPTIPSTDIAFLLMDVVTGRTIRQYNISIKSEFEASTFFQLGEETGLNIPVQSVSFEVNQGPTTPFQIQDQTGIVINLTYAMVTL